jgi:hypothetical protein
MANTVSTISYANTFGQWMTVTNALSIENNNLAANDYVKSSGTLYLNETTKNSLQANGTVVIQKQLLVQGVGSSASIDNNLSVSGQVYFTNTTLGLTNSGQANMNGLVLAQGPGTGLYVSNNAIVNGNAVIQYNTTTNYLQANSTVNTATASVTGTTWTNNLIANSKITGAVASISGPTFVDTLQANTSILTGSIQANTSVNTNLFTANTLSVTGTSYTNVLQANSTVNTTTISVTGTTWTNILRANTTMSVPTANITTQIDANNAVGYFGSLQTIGQLSVGGNFVINGSTVYNSNNFTLNAQSSTGQISYFNVNRGSSGANASIRWNESSAYWDILNVGSSTYYRLLTDDYPGYYSTSSFARANAAYAAANAAAGTFIGTTGQVTSNTLTFTSNNGISIYAVSANTLAISSPQDLRTSASPTFAGLTLTSPLALNQGGTSATSASGALTNILPTGTTAGYVLTTGGPGNFYWAAGTGGGGSGATPGTSINSTRLSYIANGVSGYTGNSFTTPVFTTSTQVRAYINGVRQFESEYTLNQSANTIAFLTTPTNSDAVLIEVDGYYVNPYYANNIAYTINSNISSTANTIQLAIDGLTSKVTTYYANLTGGSVFTGDIQGITMPAGTSNTSFATTAFAANAYSLTVGTLPAARLPVSGVTSGTYGGGVTSSSSQLPVITVDSTGRVTSAANVTVTSTSVYANTGQLTANAATGVVALGLPTTGVIAGNYGSGTTTPILTIDQYGRVTGATTTLITGGSAGIGATSYTRTAFTATAGQTTFSVTYTVGYVQVYVNGVLLAASDYTSSSGTSIVMGSALRSGDLVDIFAYTVTLVNNVSPSYTGGQGGSAGQVLYQSAANTTSNTDVGTSGYLLTSAGTGKPTWSNPTASLVGLGTSSNPQFNSLGVGVAASTVTGEIRAANNITAYYSDDRLKTRLGTIDNALDKLCSLTGFYYEANETAQALGYGVRKEVGVSAQDVQKVLPEIVTAAPIDDKYLTIYYDKLIPLVIEAIKELKQEVDALKGNIK